MRLIDADRLYAILENIADHLLEQKSEPEHGMAQVIQFVMGIVQDQPDIAQPPNDPLTLEELRKMGGEPVWVLQPSSLEKSKYALVYVENEWLIATKNRGWLFSEVEKGEVIVYRRRPEEGTA